MRTNKFALFLFVMMSALTSNANEYQPVFGNDSTYYTVLFGGKYLTRIQKDTLIDNLVYKILPLGNFVRISADNSKAYLRPKSNPYELYNQKEYLVMDLNLKLGDYFVINDTISSTQFNFQRNSNDTLIVDSVYFKDGLKHIRFNRTMYHDFNWIQVGYPFEFIEGVGTIIGFEYRPLTGQLYRNDNPIVCYFKDGTRFYSSDVGKSYRSNDECISDEMLGINEKKMGNPIQITYDKNSNHLTVKSVNNAETDCSITLYSTNGTLLVRADEITLPRSISLSNLPNGVYIALFKTANKVFNRKIVVNR